MMGAELAAIDPTTGRDAWLAERRKGIGASEAPAALGLSPYQTPFGLWCLKTGAVPPAEETEAMRWGSRLEPVLAEAFAESTGLEIARSQVFRRHDGRPHLLATADGLTADGDLVELKTISAFKAGELGEDGTDELPDHWLVQAQQQMYVFGRPLVRFGVLVGGQRFRTYTVHRDDALLDAIIPRLDRFWSQVTSNTPPEATGRDAATLASLRPSEGTRVELASPLLPGVASEYEEAGRLIRQLEEDRRALKARLIEAMGDAAVATLLDGREVVRKVIDRKGFTVEPGQYVDFRIRSPKA